MFGGHINSASETQFICIHNVFNDLHGLQCINGAIISNMAVLLSLLTFWPIFVVMKALNCHFYHNFNCKFYCNFIEKVGCLAGQLESLSGRPNTKASHPPLESDKFVTRKFRFLTVHTFSNKLKCPKKT